MRRTHTQTQACEESKQSINLNKKHQQPDQRSVIGITCQHESHSTLIRINSYIVFSPIPFTYMSLSLKIDARQRNNATIPSLGVYCLEMRNTQMKIKFRKENSRIWFQYHGLPFALELQSNRVFH